MIRIKKHFFFYILFICLVVAALALSNYIRKQDARYDCEESVTRNISLHYDQDVDLNRRNAFSIYENLRRKIMARDITDKDLRAFRRVVKEKKELEKIESLVRKLDGWGSREKKYKKLYALLMKASPNTDVLYYYLKSNFKKILRKADKNDHKRGSYYAWPWAYGAQAAVIAYEESGEERFLDLLVSSYDIILENRDSDLGKIDALRGRALDAWGTSKPWRRESHPEGMWINVITLAGRITYPVSMFCKIVVDDEKLHPKFLKKAEYYLDSIEKALGEFSDDFRIMPRTGEGYYWNPILETVEPLNHSHSAGNTLVMMYAITNKEEYRIKAEHLARYFLSSTLTEKNGAYVWGYRPTPENRRDERGEPVWKGHITLSFPLLAYEHGLVFDKADMKALNRTFTENIYHGKSRFNHFIGLEKTRPLCFDKTLRKPLAGILGWIFLDSYNPEIREILEDSIAIRTDIMPRGWFKDTMTALAYSHRLSPLK